MDFLDSLKSSSSDYAGGSNKIASMDFENGAMWAYNFLTRWYTPGVDGYPDVDARVLLRLHKDGDCHIVFGFYRGNDCWETASGDVISFGCLNIVGWRYFFDADK